MIFHKSNFTQFLDADQAHLIAKVANELIATEGTVLYGCSFSDGSSKDYSTEKKATDTHVCITMGIAAMGALKPSSSPIKTEMPTEEDMLRAAKELNKHLTKENHQLRGKL